MKGVLRAVGANGLSASGGGVGRYSPDGRRPDVGPGESGGIEVGVLAVGDAGWVEAWEVRTVVVLVIVSPARLLWIVCGVAAGCGGGWNGLTPRSPLT